MQTWRGGAARAGTGPSEATNVAMPLAAKISNTVSGAAGGRWQRAGGGSGSLVDLPSTAVAQFVGFYFWPFALAEHIARLPYCQIASLSIQLAVLPLATCRLPLATCFYATNHWHNLKLCSLLSLSLSWLARSLSLSLSFSLSPSLSVVSFILFTAAVSGACWG